MRASIIALIVVAVVLLAALAAYYWSVENPAKSNFVGAFGRAPGMQYCLQFDGPADRKYNFNRCTWV